MIAEIGHFALWLAMALSLVQAAGGLAGASRSDAAWMRAGGNAANAQCLMVVIAFAALATSFIDNDF